MTDPANEPQPIAVAMEWVSRIFAIGLEMVLPGLLGKWLDDRWGTSFLSLLGLALGVSLGLWHLILITKAASDQEARRRASRAGGQAGSQDRRDGGPADTSS